MILSVGIFNARTQTVSDKPTSQLTFKAVPPNLISVVEEADNQVGARMNDVLKTVEGQAWMSAQNYRDARILYVMNELGLKITDGWQQQRDPKTNKFEGFKKVAP